MQVRRLIDKTVISYPKAPRVSLKPEEPANQGEHKITFRKNPVEPYKVTWDDLGAACDSHYLPSEIKEHLNPKHIGRFYATAYISSDGTVQPLHFYKKTEKEIPTNVTYFVDFQPPAVFNLGNKTIIFKKNTTVIISRFPKHTTNIRQSKKRPLKKAY
jgi:hypothetical protein